MTDNAAVNIRLVLAILTMVSLAVGAAWTTRDFADDRAREALAAFNAALRHHEQGSHAASISRDEYRKDIEMMQKALIRIDDKLDKLTATRR